MNEIIKIKCPRCGAVLSVRYFQGIETKNVTCPICENKGQFNSFRKISDYDHNQDPNTEYGFPRKFPQEDIRRHDKQSEEHTEYQYPDSKSENKSDLRIGILRQPGTNISYQLIPGRNVIGRKSVNSGANFQIDTGDKRSMSREHLIIDVKKDSLKGIVHCISLYKEKVNRTFVDNKQLLIEDCVILKDGDIIKLPDATLIFKIPDGDATIY